MKELFGIFKIRKIVLAAADIFIVGVTALMSNFILSFFKLGIDETNILVSVAVSSICCIGALMITGAYSKLWRYFNGKDYLSCLYGALIGIFASAVMIYIADGSIYPAFSILHLILLCIGICFFRYLFKTAFIILLMYNE